MKTNLQYRSGDLRWFIFISLKSRKLSRQIQRDSENGRSDSTLIYILQSRGLKFGRRREIFVSEIRLLPFLWKSIRTWWNTQPLKSFYALSEEICWMWKGNKKLGSFLLLWHGQLLLPYTAQVLSLPSGSRTYLGAVAPNCNVLLNWTCSPKGCPKSKRKTVLTCDS